MLYLLKNEKGVTLVELLATLSLFSIVIVLSSTIIVQLLNGKETTQDHINTTQDLNILISELWNQYDEGIEFNICNTSSGFAFPAKSIVFKIKLKYSFSNHGNNISHESSIGECIEVDPFSPLYVNVQPVNGNKSVSIKTTFLNKEALVLSVKQNIGGGDIIPDYPLDNILITNNSLFQLETKVEEFEVGFLDLRFDQDDLRELLRNRRIEKHYNEVSFSSNNCIIPNHTTFRPSFDLITISKLAKSDEMKVIYPLIGEVPILITDIPCEQFTIQGNAWIEDGKVSMQSPTSLVINDNLYIKDSGELILDNSSALSVGTDSIIDGNIGYNSDQNSPATIKFLGDATINSDTIIENSGSTKLIIEGNPTFLGEIQLISGGSTEIEIRGNPVFESDVTLSSSSAFVSGSPKLTINGNATFKNNIELSRGLLSPGIPEVNIAGDANFYGKIELAGSIFVQPVIEVNGTAICNETELTKRIQKMDCTP